MTRRVYLHVGASKTGTSALQQGLWRSVEALAEAGVGLPLVGRPAHVRRLLRPMGWVASRGYVEPIRRSEVLEVAGRIRETAQPTLVMSNEDLAELDAERIDLLMELYAEADVEPSIVLTARTWSRQLPSEYQQFLKHRLTTGYSDWLDQVRTREGFSAGHFWQRQDFAGIARAWARVLPADRIHVIVSPSQPLTAGAELFCAATGIPADRIDLPTRSINASFGAVESEVYRRLNASLPAAFDDYEGAYYPGVRLPIVTGVLPRQASAKLLLPPEHLGWVSEEAERQVADLRSGGYRLHGDVSLLHPAPSDCGELPEVAEAEVSAAAIAAMGRLFVRLAKAKE